MILISQRSRYSNCQLTILNFSVKGNFWEDKNVLVKLPREEKLKKGQEKKIFFMSTEMDMGRIPQPCGKLCGQWGKLLI